MSNRNNFDIIEGKHAVLEASLANAPLVEIVFAKNFSDQKFVKKIQSIFVDSLTKIKIVDKFKLDEISVRGSHQGVIAKMKKYNYCNIKEISNHSDPNSMIIVLDHIKDSGNFGAIIRSAESVGASGIIIPNKRSASVTATTYKTSAGAVSHMKIVQVSNIARCLESMKKQGFWVVGASEHAKKLIWQIDLKGRIALVMGSEENGISSLVLQKCDFVTKLPQQGKISSLNVAQASTVFMYEWLKQNFRN